MICKDFERLIHLFLDQELDEQKREELEKHLAECQKCREKFETLKLVEEKAKGIKIPEPEEAYWERFSQRVRQRIISRQKQPFGAKLRGFLTNIFVFPPTRLKVAAVVASLILVIIVGKLYIDYRGTVPERVKYAEKETTKGEAPKMEKKIAAYAPEETAPPMEETKIEKQKAPDTKKGAIEEKREKPAPAVKPEPKGIDAGKGAELMAKKAVIRDVGKKAPVPEVMEQEVAKPIEKEEAPKAAMRVMADLEDKKAKPESKVAIECFIDRMPPEKTTPQEICEFWFADSIRIPDIDYFGRGLSADSLSVIRDFWKRFIQDNPDDPFVEYAYLQIAGSYYYLFDKTKDESIRVEGIKQIEEFLKITKEEEINENLEQNLEKLKGLKEK